MKNPADISAWVFDLDNTIYPASCNLFAQVDVRMRDYICNLLDLPADEARVIQKKYFRDYGTTLRGLMDEHKIDPKDYLDYVHDIDLAPIDHNPALKASIDALPGGKFIFTNGSRGHALNVLGKMGLTDCFEDIFDIIDAGFRPKPEPAIYPEMITRFGIDPHSSIMIEDMARNLRPAENLGMQTVWVRTPGDISGDGEEADYIHLRIDDVASWLLDLESQIAA